MLRKVAALYGFLLLIAAVIAVAGVVRPSLPDGTYAGAAPAEPTQVLGTPTPTGAATPMLEPTSPPPSTARPNAAPKAVAGGAYFVAEGDSVALKASGSDPDGDPLNFSWDLDGDGVFETAGQTVTFSAAGLDGPSTRPVTVLVCDGTGSCAAASALVSIANAPPNVGSVKGPSEPLPLNSTVGVIVDFSNAGVLDTHAVTWEWGDGTRSPANVFESGGAGTASGTHNYTKPGEYRIKAIVTDKDGSTGETLSPPIRIVERR